nr:hypothetical protein [Lachnospiraceae bacterium]
MKNIDAEIARSEAEWCRYSYQNMGVRESLKQLSRAFMRSAGKRAGRVVRNIGQVMKRTAFQPTYEEGKENLVVSLTSTGDRIRHILPTLYSLAAQTRKPDLIVLWLGKDRAYPGKIISQIREMGVLIKYR